MTTTDDPRMGEFDDLATTYVVAVRVECSTILAPGATLDDMQPAIAAAGEARAALRSWVAANLSPPPAGEAETDERNYALEYRMTEQRKIEPEPPARERAELVRECRERSAWFDTCRESAGYPRPASGDTAALLTRAADALEAGLASSPTEPAISLASRVDQLAARVAELEDRVERLGDDSQEHHDRLWTLEDRTGELYERLDGVDRELGEANRRAITEDDKTDDKTVRDSVTAEIDAALLALYLEGYREALMDHTQLDVSSLKPHLANEGHWRQIIAERGGRWPARDRVRALLTERRES